MKKYRLQVDLSKPELAALEKLMQDLGVSSKKELVISALSKLKWDTDKRKIGFRNCAISQDGKTIIDCEMPIFLGISPSY